MASDETKLEGPRLGAVSGKVDSLVVFCHGYGANGADLIGLGAYWQRILPNTAFVSPNAPLPLDMGGGMAGLGFQWFPITSRDPAAMRRGVELAAPTLENFIAGELEGFGLAGDRLALVGFSQGTMMSLYLGLRREVAPAAIIGFSGALPASETLGETKHRPPILLVHGDADPMIPPQATLSAAETLLKNGFDCQYHISPSCGHSIAADGLELGGRFLHHHLNA